MGDCFILTFPSTHNALKAERLAVKAELKVKMIPVPRSLSADCNMGLKISASEHDALVVALTADDVIFASHPEP